MENIFLIIGLTANILTLVLFKICNWPKKKHQEQPFWDFGSYSNWLLKYTCVTVLLNLETIYSNLLIQIGHFVITDVLMATLIGSVMMIFGFYTCKSYDKMNFRVEYEDIEKNNPWMYFKMKILLYIVQKIKRFNYFYNWTQLRTWK